MSLLLCFWGGWDLQAAGLRLFGIEGVGGLLRHLGRLLEPFAKVHKSSAERGQDWTLGFAGELFAMQFFCGCQHFLLSDAGQVGIEFKRVEHDGSSFWITSSEVV